MFSGIVEGLADVVSVKKEEGLTTFSVKTPFSSSKIKKSSSISIDGVCLTVSDIKNNQIFFDAMKGTLDKTTLKSINVGNKVNIERSIKVGDEIGGHEVSGHVDSVAKIIKIVKPKNNHIVTFLCDRGWMRYIFPKGFIALDGASLTVVDVRREKGEFTVHLIPETLRLTTFGFKKVGEFVNLEIDRRTQIIVETMENIAKEKK